MTEAYEGAFSEEFDFRGMGEYSDVYSEDVRKLEEKADEIAASRSACMATSWR